MLCILAAMAAELRAEQREANRGVDQLSDENAGLWRALAQADPPTSIGPGDCLPSVAGCA
jgi:hypothetical protein